MMMKEILSLFLCMLGLAASAAEPAFWNTDGAGELSRRRLTAALPAMAWNADEEAAGMALSATDLNSPLGDRFRLPEPLVRHLDLVGTPGDYYTALLGLYAWQPQRNLTLKVSDLVADGAVIPAANLTVLEAIDNALNPENRVLTEPLLKPDWIALPAGTAVPLMVFVDIPADARPGIYRGTLRVESANGSLRLPLRLRVMAFRLPELTESAGFFVPGHFHIETDRGIYVNMAPASLIPENLDHFFRFYRSRRLNSVVLCHVAPGLQLADGNVQADFRELSQFAAAMRRAGLNGKLIIDLRPITWWCNTVARQNSKLPAEPDAFHPASADYFRPVLRQLLETAEKENWPDWYFFPEEEMGNGPRQQRGYDFFLPILQEVCPQRIAVIDNDIGYNRRVEVDRGHRDRIVHRQYNSWTEQAWADARRDGAEVWTYNYDISRLAAGLLQQRLGSRGHHQWADLWTGKRKNSTVFWGYSILTGRGVVTTRGMERFHDGRLDLAACKLLEQSAGELRKRGNDAAAQMAEKTLQDVTADIPINGTRFRSWQCLVPNREIDLRRWKIFTAIERAQQQLSGQPANEIAAGGTPALTVERIADGTGKNDGRPQFMALFQAPSPLRLDGRHEEPVYGDGTGAIPYILQQENAIRAKCSSEEEFKSFAPSYAAAYLCYGYDGLYFAADAGLQTAKEPFLRQRQNDDPELWRDDSLQFFFLVPEQEDSYQLTVNSAGCRTLMHGGRVVPIPDCEILVRSPLDADGGIAVEGFLPWKYFDLPGMPSPGTEWRFNFARQFHTRDQLTSWGRVDWSFQQREFWGGVCFSGQSPSRAFAQLALPAVYPGPNRLAGLLQQEVPAGTVLAVENAAGEAADALPVGSGGSFALSFVVPAADIGSKWQLVLRCGDREIERLPLPVQPLLATVAWRGGEDKVSGDDTLTLLADVCYPSGLFRPVLTGKLLGPAGIELTLPEAPLSAPGRCRIRLQAAGLTPGRWQLQLEVPGVKPAGPVEAMEFEVLPPRFEFRESKPAGK